MLETCFCLIALYGKGDDASNHFEATTVFDVEGTVANRTNKILVLVGLKFQLRGNNYKQVI